MAKRRPGAQQRIHPFAMPLFGGLAAALFGVLYWLFGVGGKAFEFSASIALFYTASVLITLAIAGLIWAAFRLFGALQTARPAVSTELVIFLSFLVALAGVTAWVLLKVTGTVG